MRVFHCEDAPALEACFRERVAAAAGSRPGPFAPLTVVAPTARLLTRLQVLAGEALGAAAGIRFEVHGSLAQRVMTLTGARPARLLGTAALERIALEAVRGTGGRLAAAAERIEGFGAALASTFRDLRDARVDARELPSDDEVLTELWSAYGRFTRILGGLAARGELDSAGVLAEAARRLAKGGVPLGPVLHTGAFDLTGAARELVAALASAGPLEILTIGVAAEDEYAFGAERWAAFASASEGAAVAGQGLYSRARGAPGAPAAVEWVAAGSAREELELACRRALRWIGEGTPPVKIGILARSLEPYAAAMPDVLGEHGLVHTSSAEIPLTEHPRAAAFAASLECLEDDFPRAAFCELLRCRPVARALLGEDPGDAFADRIDLVSRQYSVKGERGFSDAFPRDARGADGADADRVSTIARRLAGAGRGIVSAGSWRAAAEAAARLFEEAFTGDGACDPRADEIDEVLTAALLELAPLDGAVPWDGARAFLHGARRAVERASVPLARADHGGVRVLDFQQARGLDFDRVAIVGLDEARVPRKAREDPLLTDAAREALSVAVSRDVPRKGDAVPEELWLLTLALASARDGAVVSYARRDADGRILAESPFARRAAAVLGGARGFSEIPWHPGGAARWILTNDRLLTPRQAISAAGLLAGDPRAAASAAAEALGSLDGAFAASLAQLTAIESFEGASDGALRFDGQTEPLTIQSFSPKGLERLGTCPLQYFFAERLRVKELDDPDLDPDVDRASVGEAVHAALAELYSGGIWRRERFADPASRRRAVEGAIERAFDATLTDLARGAPALEASLRRRWTEAVADFVENDVAALTSFGARAADVELPFRVDLELDGAAFTLRGRIDRICEGAEGRRVVADYKTGARDVDEYLKPRSLDKGRTLQLPLYALAVESLRAGLPDIEAIRIHPDLDTRGRKNVKRLDASELADARAGLARAVSTLVALARAGRFPLTPKPDEDCAFCAYRIACRRLHAPTRERQLTAEAYAAFYRLREGTGAEEPGGEESSS